MFAEGIIFLEAMPPRMNPFLLSNPQTLYAALDSSLVALSPDWE